jgi:hypothetical protein
VKYVLLQIVVLTVIVLAGVAVAHQPVRVHWGESAVVSLRAAALICWVVAVLAAVPVGLAATYWRAHTAMVAFAGTAVRLLGTAGAGLAYQLIFDPPHEVFLGCLLANYLLLLLAETGLIVYIVSRAAPPDASPSE